MYEETREKIKKILKDTILESIEKTFIKRYQKQLEIYAFALEKFYGQKLESMQIKVGLCEIGINL